MQMVLALSKSFHARRRGGQRGSTLHSTCPLSPRKSSQHADQPGISHANTQPSKAAPGNEHFISLSKAWVLLFCRARHAESQSRLPLRGKLVSSACVCVHCSSACVHGRRGAPNQLPFHYVFQSARIGPSSCSTVVILRDDFPLSQLQRKPAWSPQLSGTLAFQRLDVLAVIKHVSVSFWRPG